MIQSGKHLPCKREDLSFPGEMLRYGYTEVQTQLGEAMTGGSLRLIISQPASLIGKLQVNENL